MPRQTGGVVIQRLADPPDRVRDPETLRWMGVTRE